MKTPRKAVKKGKPVMAWGFKDKNGTIFVNTSFSRAKARMFKIDGSERVVRVRIEEVTTID